MLNALINPLAKFAVRATWCPGVIRRAPLKIAVRLFELRYLLTGRLE